jgi:F-type H+-transporting ATPase subunit delta
VNPTLQGYAAEVLEEVGPVQLPAVAAELAAIERLVVSSPLLQGALTDTAVTATARAAIMRDLLEGRVSEPARRAAAFATSAVSAPESVAALNWLALKAHRAAEGHHEAEPPLGLLEARRRVGGYARAIFETLSTAQLEEMEDELFRFAQIVGSTPALRGALVDRDVAVEARQGLVSQLLEGKVQPSTVNLVRYAVAGGRARDIVGTLNWLVEQTAAARGWRIARVRAAAPVDESQQSELSASLTDLAGFPVELQVVIEPSLLSGAVIQIGDLQVDATARGRLDALREHLVPGGWDDKLTGPGQGPTNGTTTEGAA